MQRADVVMVSNAVLLQRHRQERDDLILVSNGVDPELFSTVRPRPADLPTLDPAHPLVGYHGAIAEWFDFELLTAVAQARPGWRFVLVGPVAPAVAARASTLGTLPNVWLMERPSDTMPGYVQAFDVGAIWFRVNTMTEGVTPLKMYEYLAAGVPCVSTPLPACVAEPLVSTASQAGEFVDRLEEALASSADPAAVQSRIEAAGHQSWLEHLQPVLERLRREHLDRDLRSRRVRRA